MYIFALFSTWNFHCHSANSINVIKYIQFRHDLRHTHTHIHSDILLCYGDDIELRYAIRLVSFAMFTPKGE